MRDADFLAIGTVKVATKISGSANEGGMAFNFPRLDGGGVAAKGPGRTNEEDRQGEPGEEIGDDEDEEVGELENGRSEILMLLESGKWAMTVDDIHLADCDYRR